MTHYTPLTPPNTSKQPNYRQMNDLGRVSAIQDGHVNVAHARKKRRLDQEFERMLEKTAEKQAELRAIEHKVR